MPKPDDINFDSKEFKDEMKTKTLANGTMF